MISKPNLFLSVLLLTWLESSRAWNTAPSSTTCTRFRHLQPPPTTPSASAVSSAVTFDTSRSRIVCRISNIFNRNDKNTINLPKDVKEAVSKCRQATQEALQGRCSRMDIEFPVGTKFNVEKTPKTKMGKSDLQRAPNAGDLVRSDRELARLFVDMFQPVGGESIAVVFNDVEQADFAKKKWQGDSTAQCRILSLDRRKSSMALKKKKRAASKTKGFAAKMAQELDDDPRADVVPSGPFQLPPNTQVALFVAPGPKELIVVQKICEQVGMDTCVILLNARLHASHVSFASDEARHLYLEEFDPVFSLSAAPQDVAPNGLMYRAYPHDWVLARKPKVGQPTSLLSCATRPTVEQCREAFDNLELSAVERNLESAMENVAGWLK